MTSSRPRAGEPIKYVPKGWGYEKWIANSEDYCGKLLYIVKDKKCSWHYHNKKDEVFYIQSGRIRICYGWTDSIEMATVATLERGDKFHVPVGMRHQMYALEDTELFEFSTEHFDSDSIRVTPGDTL